MTRLKSLPPKHYVSFDHACTFATIWGYSKLGLNKGSTWVT